MSILAAEPSMTIAEKQHRTIRWATRVLTCGSTIILHTKSATRTAGLCEIAAVDTDGGVLLNTLVNPGATLGGLWNTLDPHLHSDALTEAPTPANAVQLLVDITTTSRHVLAYNADHDRQIITTEARRCDIDLDHLDDPDLWGCVIRARAEAAGHPDSFQPLDGQHEALTCCYATLSILQNIAEQVSS